MTDNEFKGRAWYHPGQNKIYGGAAGTYQAGILTDVSTIEAKNVLAELLGLARPLYKLDEAVTTVSAPELVLSVDTETVGSGSEDVKPLEESLVQSKTFARSNFECILNEAHIVVDDRAAMKASHEILRLNISAEAREMRRVRNTHNSRRVQAGLLNVGQTTTVTLPGWPNVKVLVDCGITNGSAIIGSKRAVILAEGPTESVRYRNELKRYTGYIIRQYIQPKIVVAGAIRELTEISSD